jgi:hypothetical protein
MSGCQATTELATSWLVHDRRARYRKRRHARASEPASDPAKTQTPAEPALVNEPNERNDRDERDERDERNERDERPQTYDGSARWRHITELNARLSETLDADGRALWLALEEALHVHWLDVAVDHYNRGYAAGRAQRWVDDALADTHSVHDKLRAIALALAEVIEAFDIPRRSS